MRSSLYVTLMSGGTAFDPVSLFAKYNASGFYHNFAGPPTRSLGGGLLVPMYQDQAGTPVDEDGESIGLAIDESQGAAVGAEVAVNGDFDADTDWTKSGTTISGGGLQFTGTASAYAFQDPGIEIGDWYLVTLVVSAYTSGRVRVRVGTTGYTDYALSAGTHTFIRQATGTSRLQVESGGAGNELVGTVDSVSCEPIAGNHGLQTTASAKPTVKTGSPNFARGDGVDDNLLSSLNPSTTMTLIEVGTPDSGAASDVLIGSQPASNGKAYLALSSSGYLAGGVGTQATSTIVDSTATDIRSVKCGKAIQWNGSTVRLFLKVAGGSFAKVYEAAQSGAVNTTIPFRILSLNNNGTSAASADTDTLLAMALDAEVNESDIEATMDHFLNL